MAGLLGDGKFPEVNKGSERERERKEGLQQVQTLSLWPEELERGNIDGHSDIALATSALTSTAMSSHDKDMWIVNSANSTDIVVVILSGLGW